MADFHRCCEQIAKRFLQTVVIVDDEAYIRRSAQPPGVLETPGRDARVHGAKEETESETEPAKPFNHSLDAGLLSKSFSEHGLICAVVTPAFDGDTADDALVPPVTRTDIVILDWRLNDDDGEMTLSILKHILKDDAGKRLRLIAIYTGEQNISGIGQTILEQFDEFKDREHGVVLSSRHCRIVIYAKSNVHLAVNLEERSVSESDLPRKLIKDFAIMTGGLLPNIALTALAAIRENTHKILERFDSKLDPAFLTHRACLLFPDDSQQDMVNQLANELYAVMNEGVAAENPAGMQAIQTWMEYYFRSDSKLDLGLDKTSRNKTMSRDQALTLLKYGIEDDRKPDVLNKKKGFLSLTTAFSNGGNPDDQLDLQFAWMLNFRTIFNAPPPTLGLGSVLRKSQENEEQFFVCMRPRCDSVRLQQATTFLLLPLIDPDHHLLQFVLCKDKDTYKRISVCMEMNQWSLVKFQPNQYTQSVVAEHDSTGFYFTDTASVRFDWLGELKMEFAQRIAHEFTSGLSRVAVTDSEWLLGKAKQ